MRGRRILCFYLNNSSGLFSAYTLDYIHHFFTQRNDTFLPFFFFFCLEHSLDLLLELNDLWLRLYIPTYHQFHWLINLFNSFLLTFVCWSEHGGKKWACVYLWRANVLEIKCRRQNMAIDCEIGLREGPVKPGCDTKRMQLALLRAFE